MNDLTSAFKDLGPSIQNTMAAVHSLDVVAVNAQPVPRFRREFPAWRHTLKAHWTEIKDLLSQCYDVIDSLIILVRSTGQYSDRECISFLQELMNSVNTIEIGFRPLITQNSDISRKFAIASRRFMTSRRSSITAIGPTIDLSFQRPTVAPDLSPDLRAFVANQIDAAYPDSSSASASASQYLADTEKHLSTILDFWTTLRTDWQNMIIIPMSKQRIVEKYSRRIPSWELDREHIRVAIASISRSIDAITVEAARIPQRRSTADESSSLFSPNLDSIIIPQAHRNAPLPPLPLCASPRTITSHHLHQAASATATPPTSYAYRPSESSITTYTSRSSSVSSVSTAHTHRPSSESSTSRAKPASPSTLSKPRKPTSRPSSEASYRESKSKANSYVPTLKELFVSSHSSSKKKGW